LPEEFTTIDSYGTSAGAYVALRRGAVQAFVAFETYPAGFWESPSAGNARVLGKGKDLAISVELHWMLDPSGTKATSFPETGDRVRRQWAAGSSSAIWSEVVGQYVSLYAEPAGRPRLFPWS
jgi:hypothetical protein